MHLPPRRGGTRGCARPRWGDRVAADLGGGSGAQGLSQECARSQPGQRAGPGGGPALASRNGVRGKAAWAWTTPRSGAGGVGIIICPCVSWPIIAWCVPVYCLKGGAGAALLAGPVAQRRRVTPQATHAPRGIGARAVYTKTEPHRLSIPSEAHAGAAGWFVTKSRCSTNAVDE